MKQTPISKRYTENSNIDFSDIPETAENFWADADIVLPKEKTAISIRLDNDVLDFFRNQGKGYQTKINAILRSYMDHIHA